MVGADDDPGLTAARDELMRAMLANVVEGADFPVATPNAKRLSPPRSNAK